MFLHRLPPRRDLGPIPAASPGQLGAPARPRPALVRNGVVKSNQGWRRGGPRPRWDQAMSYGLRSSTRHQTSPPWGPAQGGTRLRVTGWGDPMATKLVHHETLSKLGPGYGLRSSNHHPTSPPWDPAQGGTRLRAEELQPPPNQSTTRPSPRWDQATLGSTTSTPMGKAASPHRPPQPWPRDARRPDQGSRSSNRACKEVLRWRWRLYVALKRWMPWFGLQDGGWNHDDWW